MTSPLRPEARAAMERRRIRAIVGEIAEKFGPTPPPLPRHSVRELNEAVAQLRKAEGKTPCA